LERGSPRLNQAVILGRLPRFGMFRNPRQDPQGGTISQGVKIEPADLKRHPHKTHPGPIIPQLDTTGRGSILLSEELPDPRGFHWNPLGNRRDYHPPRATSSRRARWLRIVSHPTYAVTIKNHHRHVTTTTSMGRTRACPPKNRYPNHTKNKSKTNQPKQAHSQQKPNHTNKQSTPQLHQNTNRHTLKNVGDNTLSSQPTIIAASRFNTIHNTITNEYIPPFARPSTLFTDKPNQFIRNARNWVRLGASTA
jgi:hypothetical protein